MSAPVKLTIVAPHGCIGSTVHGLLDAFACANACAAGDASGPAFEVRIASPDGDDTRSFSGQPVAVDGRLDLAENADVIVLAPVMPPLVSAAEIAQRIRKQDALIGWLRKQEKVGTVIATSCTGSFLLAEAGLLDGKIATTHWRAASAFRDRYPQVVLRESELVADSGGLICSGGAVSYLDLAIHLIRRFGGPALALRCARMLVFDPGRDSQSPYLEGVPNRLHGDAQVLKVQDLLETRYWEEFSVEGLAEMLGMSARNLKRRFRAACGESITGYLQRVRIAAACDRLATGDAPLQQIIFDVGYSDASSFARLFKETTGVTMGDYRRRFRAPVRTSGEESQNAKAAFAVALQ